MKSQQITVNFNSAETESHSISRLQMAVAFFAGVFVAAIMALIPVTSGLFYPGSSQESIVPVQPNLPYSPLPEITGPEKPRFVELVYTFDIQDVLPC